MPCSLLNFSDFSSVLQREVVKKQWKLEGNHFRAPLSSPKTFQIDVNKLKKQSSQFCQAPPCEIWYLKMTMLKKKSSRTWQMILISWYRLFRVFACATLGIWIILRKINIVYFFQNLINLLESKLSKCFLHKGQWSLSECNPHNESIINFTMCEI